MEKRSKWRNGMEKRTAREEMEEGGGVDGDRKMETTGKAGCKVRVGYGFPAHIPPKTLQAPLLTP